MPRRAFAAERRLLALAAALLLAGCVGGGEPVVGARAFQRDAERDGVAAARSGDAPGTRAAGGAAAEPEAAPPGAPLVPMPVMGAAAVDAAAPAAAAPASPGAGGDEVDERELRRQLATADDPTAAALDLAQALFLEERVAEALAAVDTALARVRNDELRVARSGLLRDLGQRHAAVAELRALRRDVGAASLHPSLLFELAQLEWLEGDAAASQATLQQLATMHADHRWVVEQVAARDRLAADVARGGLPKSMPLRDLFGNLRGAPAATERLAVLDQLHADAKVKPGHRQRAVAIALGDESPAVRARAVQLAVPTEATMRTFCATALADGAPVVRRAAAPRAVELLGAGARPLLLDRLAAEQDTGAFLAVHHALAKLAGLDEPLDELAAADASTRAEVVARWRSRSTP